MDTKNGKSNLDLCPLCRDTHSNLQPCTCQNQVTSSTTQLSSHDNSLQFSQEISSSAFFTLPCTSASELVSHVNGHSNSQSFTVKQIKTTRKFTRISLPRKKAKSVQVDFPKRNKNVQVNLTCETSNFLCQTNVPASNKSSQSISSQQTHCSVQTEDSQEYLEHGENEISVSQFFKMFWEHLKSFGQCDDFIKLAYSLMVQQIPSDNMAWLSALHMGWYSRCKTTCNMRYDPKYTEYFSLLYLLFGSSVVNVLRGPAHFGSVVTKDNDRSKYDPAMAKCNFAVPTVNRLRQVNFGCEKKNKSRDYLQVYRNM